MTGTKEVYYPDAYYISNRALFLNSIDYHSIGVVISASTDT